MLYTFPIGATDENWISATLLDVLRMALEALKQGNEPREFQDAIPAAYQAEFMRGTKFQELYREFIDQSRLLTPAECGLVLSALMEQNNFPAVFTSNTPCSSIEGTLPAVHEASKNLFKHAFEKLSVLKTPGSQQTIRAGYHQLVGAHLPYGSCPFCGYELLEAVDPDLVDPDLDHYLAVSKYPFAGVNLRNLTAMGTICNRSYKGAQDILCDEHGHRVDCIDPYGNEQVTISLEGTVLLPGEGQGPAWSLAFNPDAKSQNWRRVFRLESRLKATVLEKRYQKWLTECVNYAQENEIDISSRDGVLEAVRKFRNTCKLETLPSIARLKENFFELIEAELNDPEEGDRMHNFVTAVQAA